MKNFFWMFVILLMIITLASSFGGGIRYRENFLQEILELNDISSETLNDLKLNFNYKKIEEESQVVPSQPPEQIPSSAPPRPSVPPGLPPVPNRPSVPPGLPPVPNRPSVPPGLPPVPNRPSVPPGLPPVPNRPSVPPGLPPVPNRPSVPSGIPPVPPTNIPFVNQAQQPTNKNLSPYIIEGYQGDMYASF